MCFSCQNQNRFYFKPCCLKEDDIDESTRTQLWRSIEQKLRFVMLLTSQCPSLKDTNFSEVIMLKLRFSHWKKKKFILYNRSWLNSITKQKLKMGAILCFFPHVHTRHKNENFFQRKFLKETRVSKIINGITYSKSSKFCINTRK